MYHSVTINGKNTWTDYHMVPVNGIYLPPSPEQKRTTIDLKTGNGLLDVSTVLTGYPLFQNRSGELQYLILDPWDLTELGIATTLSMPSAYDVYSQILNDIHGCSGNMSFEDDPGWYYQGYFTVRSMETNSIRRSISIGYELSPYKYKNTQVSKAVTTVDASTWNSVFISQSELLSMPVIPTVTVSGTFSSETVNLKFTKHDGKVVEKSITSAGTYSWPDVVLYKQATVQIKGSSGKTATITFRPGRL